MLCENCGEIIEYDFDAGAYCFFAIIDRWETEYEHENIRVMARICKPCGMEILENLGKERILAPGAEIRKSP